MSISATHLTTDFSDVAAGSYLTASKTPTANRLQIIDVFLADSSDISTPILYGCGLAWDLVAGIQYDAVGTRHWLGRFRALGNAPTTGQITILPTKTMVACGWSWSEYDGVDTSGGNGSGAFVQTVTNSATSGTTLSATLAAFSSANNATSAGLSTDANSTLTAGSGFTILGQDNGAGLGQSGSIGQEWRATNDTTPDATIGVSAVWGIVASELRAAPSGTGFPAINVYLGLGSLPFSSSVSWTLIPSTKVKEIHIVSSGRSLDTDDFEGGSGSITFWNEDSRFTSTNTSSPYYPNIQMRVPIKVEAVQASTTYTVFRGYVDATPIGYVAPSESFCEWPLIDAFTLFQEQESEYPWSMYIRTTQPRVWLNFNEQSGSTAIDDSGNGYHGTYMNSPTPQTSFGTGMGMTFDGTTQYVQLPLSAALSGTGDFAIEWYGDISTFAGTQTIYHQQDTPAGKSIAINILSGTNNVQLLTQDSGGATQVVGTADVTGPETHVVVRRQGTTHEILVNGAIDGTTTGTARSIPAVAPTVMATNSGIFNTGGTFDAFMIYDTTITQAVAQGHFQSLLAYHAQYAGVQISYILDSIGWPSADRNIDTGDSLVLGQFVPPTTVLDMLKLSANSDFGAIYMTLSGLVRFRSRSAIMKSPYTSSQGTFGNQDNLGHLPVVIDSLKFEKDPKRVKNDVTLSVNWQTGPIVTAPYEVKVRKRNQSSVDNYGAKTWSRDIYTMALGGTSQTALVLNDLADLTLARYAQPIQEVREMTIIPHERSSAALWNQVLTRVQEDRITHAHREPSGNVIGPIDYHIQRISHDLGPGKRWVTQWVISPADTQSYAVYDVGLFGIGRFGA